MFGEPVYQKLISFFPNFVPYERKKTSMRGVFRFMYTTFSSLVVQTLGFLSELHVAVDLFVPSVFCCFADGVRRKTEAS